MDDDRSTVIVCGDMAAADARKLKLWIKEELAAEASEPHPLEAKRLGDWRPSPGFFPRKRP